MGEFTKFQANKTIVMTALLITVCLLSGPTNVTGQLSIIESIWGEHDVVMISYDLESGYDWPNETDEFIDTPWAIEYPTAFVDVENTIWLAWANEGELYISRSPQYQDDWSILSKVKDENMSFSEPHLIQEATGRLWLVYTAEQYYQSADDNSTPSLTPRKDIYVTSSMDGVLWTPPVMISSSDMFVNNNPWILRAQGAFWVVWDTSPVDGMGDLMMSYSLNGQVWSEPSTMMANDNDDDYDPCLIYSNGQFMLVWTSTQYDVYSYVQDISDSYLMTYSLSKDGKTWAEPLPVYPRFSDEGSPYVSLDKNGDVLLSWSSDRMEYDEMADERDTNTDIWYSLFSKGKWSVPTALTRDNYYDDNPSIFQDADGLYWVIWEEDDVIMWSDSSSLPQITNFEPDISLSESSWVEEFDNTYLGDLTKTFQITNIGNRVLKGKIEVPLGFNTDETEFSLDRGQTQQFTITLASREEGQYLGSVEISSNDKEDPLLAISLDITVSDHSSEDEQLDIPPAPTSGGGGGGGDDDDKKSICANVPAIMLAMVLIILLAIVATWPRGKSGSGNGSSKKASPRKDIVEDDDEDIEDDEDDDEEVDEDTQEDDTDGSDEEAIPVSSGYRKPSVALGSVLGTIFCIAIMLIGSVLGPASDIWAKAQASYPEDNPRIVDQTAQKIMIWYPYYMTTPPPDGTLTENTNTMSSTYSSGTGLKLYSSTAALRQLVQVPYPVEGLRFYLSHSNTNDATGNGANVYVKITNANSGASDYFTAKCTSTKAAWCNVDISKSKIANTNGGGTYWVELTPPFYTKDSPAPPQKPISNIVYTVSPNMTMVPATDYIAYSSIPNKKFTYSVMSDKAFYQKWEKYTGSSTTNSTSIGLNESKYYKPLVLNNLKMEMNIRATLFMAGSLDTPVYPAYKKTDIIGRFSLFNPFKDQTQFTVRIAVLAPSGKEYKILDKSMNLTFQQSTNLNTTYTSPQGNLEGTYHFVGGIYYKDPASGAEVMVDKWGDTNDEYSSTMFSLVNYTPLQTVEVVQNVPTDFVKGKIPVYHIRCSDGAELQDVISDDANNVVNQIKAFSDMEKKLNVKFVHYNITTTDDLMRLVQSNVTNAIVVSYHGDSLPIPQSMVRVGDFIFQDSQAVYRFDEGQGTVALDSSIYQNPGSFIGSPKWLDAADAFSGPSSLSLNGVDDAVRIPFRSNLNLTSQTIDMFIKLNQDYTAGSKTIMNMMKDKKGWMIELNQSKPGSADNVVFTVGNGVQTVSVSGGSIDTDYWYEISVNYDNVNGAQIYINGESKGVAASIGNISFDNATPLTIGGIPGKTGSFTNMYIDNVRITKDIRNPAIQKQGSIVDAMNWIKRIGKWIAENQIVFVNQQWTPFENVGNTEMGWPNNMVETGSLGLSELLEARSLPDTINYFGVTDGSSYEQPGSLALGAGATTIQTDLGTTISQPNNEGDTYITMTLDKEMSQYSLPLYTVATENPGGLSKKDEIASALIFYGKGAIMFNGLTSEKLDLNLVAQATTWFVHKHVRPIYIVKASDSPFLSQTLKDNAVNDIKTVLTSLEAESGAKYYPIIIGSTIELQRLMNSSVKNVIVINTHGEVLPLPDDYVEGVSVDSTTSALYNFERVNGKYLHDESSNRNDGLLNGNAKVTSKSYFGGVALSLDGKKSYVEITKNSKLIPTQDSSKFTVDFSIYLNQDYNDAAKRATIVSGEYITGTGDGTQTYGYAVKVTKYNNMNNVLYFAIGSTKKDYIITYSNTGLKANQWYRIGATFDGVTMKLYIDYRLVASKAIPSGTTAFPAVLTNLRIGTSSSTGYAGEDLNAIIDNFRVSSGAKTSTELQLNTISHKKYLTALNEWIDTNGVIWVNLEGAGISYLGAMGEAWPNNMTPIGGLGMTEFLTPTLPDMQILTTTDSGTLADIGKAIDKDLPSSKLSTKGPISSGKNLPIDYDMFTIPIYSSAKSIVTGAVFIGKGFYIHSGQTYGTDGARVPLSTAVWLNTKGSVQMVYMIDTPPTKAFSESLIVESKHPYDGNTSQVFTVTRAGELRMRLHIGSYRFHDNYDTLVIKDKNGALVKTYTGTDFDIWTPWVEGDTIKIVLTTDLSGADYGFLIDQIQYMTKLPDQSGYTPMGQAEVKQQFLAREALSGKKTVFIPINSSTDFQRMLSGRVEAPIVFNLHGNSFPLPNEGSNSAVMKTDDKVPNGYLPGGLMMQIYQDQYYNDPTNQQFKTLKVSKGASNIYFDWGYGQPDAAVASDYFSIKWDGLLKVDKSDNYTFTLTTDDGSVLTIDGATVINSWYLQSPTTHVSAPLYLQAGYHNISYQYYERNGYATAKLTWNKKGSQPSQISSDKLFYKGGPGNAPEGFVKGGLTGEYFDDETLTMNVPRFARQDEGINFAWSSSPGPYVSGNFGVRWTGLLRVDKSDTYTFNFNGWNKATMWIGPVFGATQQQVLTTTSASTDSAPIKLEPGFYEIKVEYYGRTDPTTSTTAQAKLSWKSSSSAMAIIPVDNLYFYNAALSANKWIDNFGRWVSENGAVFANAVDYPFQYAIIEGYGKFPLGQAGFNEFLSPRARPVDFKTSTSATHVGAITEVGNATAAKLPSGVLLNSIQNITAPLPSGTDCIAFYRDPGSQEVTHGIIPIGRGAYVHSGGFSVAAITTMTYMYATQKDTIDTYSGVYYKGDTVIYKVLMTNKNPTKMRYLLYLSIYTTESGEKGQVIADTKILNMAQNENQTVYMTWTPVQQEKPMVYTMTLTVLDIDNTILVQTYGNNYTQVMQARVRTAAFIFKLWVEDTIGFFEPVDLHVSVTNDMYLDQNFTIYATFLNEKKRFIYWTDNYVDFEVKGLETATAILSWDRSQHNYGNQTYELGSYLCNVYLEDSTTAHSNGASDVLDVSNSRFSLVGELSLTFPTGLGNWEISFHAADGPFETIDPTLHSTYNITKAEDYEIWVRRIGWTHTMPDKNLTEINNQTSFGVAYKADSGRQLYVALDIGTWNNASKMTDFYTQKILKLKGAGDTLDRGQVQAGLWREGTTMIIAESPMLTYQANHFRSNTSITADDKGGTVLFQNNKQSTVTYELTLNEANFYKFFITAREGDGSTAGPQIGAYLQYFVGGSWKYSAETPSGSPIVMTWGTTSQIVTKNFQVKLNSTDSLYRLILVYQGGKATQLMTVAVMPSPNLDNKPPDQPRMTMGSNTDSRDDSDMQGPFPADNLNATFYTTSIPKFLLDALYQNVFIPFIGAGMPFQGPTLHLYGGKYVAVDLNWFVEVDYLGLANASVTLTIGGELELEGSGIVFSYQVSAKVDYDRSRNGTSIKDKMTWTVGLDLGVEVPIGRMMWGFPIDYKVVVHGRQYFRFLFDIYFGANVALQVTGDFADPPKVTWTVFTYFRLYAKCVVDFLLDMEKIVWQMEMDDKEFSQETRNIEDELARAKAAYDDLNSKQKEWLTNNHEKYGGYKKAMDVWGKTDDSRDLAAKLNIAKDRYNDLNRRYAESSKKLNEVKDKKQKFGPFKWIRLPSFHVSLFFLAGVAIGITMTIPMDHSFVHLLTYLELVLKFQFFIKIKFKILFWKFVLTIIDFWFIWDKIIWYNKITAYSKNADTFDNDGLLGKACVCDREYIRYHDKDAYDMLYQWSESSEYSDWGLKIFSFSKA